MANSSIFYGKGGEVAANRLEDQEVSVLALHLLQLALVYVGTPMIQEVLASPSRDGRLSEKNLRGLTPLIFGRQPLRPLRVGHGRAPAARGRCLTRVFVLALPTMTSQMFLARSVSG